MLARLVALNRQRAAEEARGHVRWLRPDYQIPRFGRRARRRNSSKPISASPPPAAARAKPRLPLRRGGADGRRHGGAGRRSSPLSARDIAQASARAARSNRRSAPRSPPWPAWASSPSTTPAPASPSAAPRDSPQVLRRHRNLRTPPRATNQAIAATSIDTRPTSRKTDSSLPQMTFSECRALIVTRDCRLPRSATKAGGIALCTGQLRKSSSCAMTMHIRRLWKITATVSTQSATMIGAVATTAFIGHTKNGRLPGDRRNASRYQTASGGFRDGVAGAQHLLVEVDDRAGHQPNSSLER